MERYEKYFNDEELQELAAKGPEFLEEFKAAQTNTVYKLANYHFSRTQLHQIKKGVEKYPTPLNPDDWSSEDLIQHAFDELIDGSHYLAAIQLKFMKQEKQIQELKEMCDYWRNKYRATKYAAEDLT